MRKRRILTVLILVLSAVVNLPAAMFYDAPLEYDGYVDSEQADSSFFDADVLQARGYGDEVYPGSGVDSEQRSFLKFDVSEMTGETIISAEFGIYLNAFSEYSHPSLELYKVGDDWSESITWNSSQTLVSGAELLGTNEQVDTPRYWVWDVFPTWDENDQVDGFVSYMVRVADEDMNNYAYFNSYENAEYQPYLHIEYIPEPATLTLLGIGGFLLRKRR